jgi:hypothetical protein
MSQYEPRPEPPPVSGWAVGGITFAATMMILIGIFQALNGLAAILNDEFFILARNYTFNLDVTGWGWVHLILGIIVALGGFFLIAGKGWARILAITLAVLSAISNFFFIPYYPWWSLLIIALCAWVIWSLTRPGALRA